MICHRVGGADTSAPRSEKVVVADVRIATHHQAAGNSN